MLLKRVISISIDRVNGHSFPQKAQGLPSRIPLQMTHVTEYSDLSASTLVYLFIKSQPLVISYNSAYPNSIYEPLNPKSSNSKHKLEHYYSVPRSLKQIFYR